MTVQKPVQKPVQQAAGAAVAPLAGTAPVAAQTAPSAPETPLTWPGDRWGLCTALRKAGSDAIRRISGDPEKRRLFLEHLDMLRVMANSPAAQPRIDFKITRGGE